MKPPESSKSLFKGNSISLFGLAERSPNSEIVPTQYNGHDFALSSKEFAGSEGYKTWRLLLTNAILRTSACYHGVGVEALWEAGVRILMVKEILLLQSASDQKQTAVTPMGIQDLRQILKFILNVHCEQKSLNRIDIVSIQND